MKYLKKIFLSFLFVSILFFSFQEKVCAQLAINSSITPAQVVAGFVGSGLTVSNINLNCPSGACGTFSNGNSTNLGLSSGSMFTTGSAAGAAGINNSDMYTVDNFTIFSDPNLTAIVPNAIYDPCILTFNVIPSCSTLTIRFVFGSDEYPEFVGSAYNDAFGFFVSGPNPSGGNYNAYNIARLPNTTPVAINSINNGFKTACTNPMPGPCTNCAYYVSNCMGTTIQYDGLTTVVTSNLAVTPCSTYSFKIAIADAGDGEYDSGVFIDRLFCSTAVTMTTSSVATCGCNGSATVVPSGGQPPYTYTWNTIPVQTTATATGLCPGTYTCTVFDNNGCVSNSNSAVVNVATLSPGTLSIPSSTNVSCNGGNNGSATANITGGTPNYTYLWNNGQTTQIATGLSAGTYTIIITDANGCITTNTVTITQPTAMSSTSTQTNILCSGGNNGTATTNPSGGNPAYTYLWSNGQITSNATGLSSGTYSVTITDTQGCSIVNTVSITATPAPTVTASATQTGCAFSNGTAIANASGGTPTYTYLWSNGQTTSTATGLSIGSYTITVTDVNGCSGVTTINISNASTPTINASGTSAGCTVPNGTATANASGGNPGYFYIWDNGETTQTITGLAIGTYSVLVTDANGCTGVSTVTINQSAAVNATSVPTNISCAGGNDGSAQAVPSGGTPGYSYIWDNGQTTQTVTGLSVGTYSVLITDANGCTAVSTVTILDPLPITVSVSGNDSICAGEYTTLTATVNGGTPTYAYTWTPGPGSGPSIVVNPNSQTTYSVSITDANGCYSLSQTFSIDVLPSANAAFDTVSSGTFGVIYSFTDVSSGGTSWIWYFGDSSNTSTEQNPVHNFPGAGTYTVTQIVYNQSGCPDTVTKIIHIQEGILIPNVFTPDGDGVNDVWYIPNSGVKDFHIEIFDRWGAKVFETTADEIRWDGHSSSGKLLTNGTYYFALKASLKSENGPKDYNTTGYVTLLTNKK